MMPRRGMLAGVPEETALSVAGRGIGDAFATGIGAYNVMKGRAIQEQGQEFEQRMARRRDEREERAFDMAAQLYPTKKRGAELETERKQFDFDQAKLEADMKARGNKEFEAALDAAASPGVTQEDLTIRFLNISRLQGNAQGVAQAMSDLKKMAKDKGYARRVEEVGAQLRPKFASAMRSGSVEEWTDLAIAASTHADLADNGFIKGILTTATEQVFKAQLPAPVADAMRAFIGAYNGGAAGNASDVWRQVLRDHPGAVPFFTQNPGKVPKIVQDEEGARAAGAKKRAEAEGELPSKLETEQAKGRETRETERVKAEEARKTERVKGEMRAAVQQARTRQEAIALLKTAQDEVKSIRAAMKNVYDEERLGALEDELAGAQSRVTAYEEMVEGFATGKPRDVTPKGVRIEVLSQARELLKDPRIKDYESLKRALDHNVKIGHLTPAEGAHLLRTEGRRFTTR